MTPAQWRQWRARVYASALTGDQKVIVLALAEFAGFQTGADARPGVKRLAAMCGLKERAVRNALRVAEEQRLIAKTDTANGQQGVCNVYRMTTTGTTVPPVDDNHRHDGAAGDGETGGTVVPNRRHGDDQTGGTVVPPTNVRPMQDQRKSVLPCETQPHVDDHAERDEPVDVEVVSSGPANDARELTGESEPVDAEIVAEERGQERGRSDPVHHSAARLVSTLIPSGFPAAVKTSLRLAASQLINGDGLPPEVVAESLRRWLARPDARPGLLPYIASDVLREGTAPPQRSKIRDWHNFAERLGEIEREYLERHPDGVGLNEHLAEAVVARESGPAPTSKARTVAEWAREAREAEQQGTAPAPHSKQRDWANLTAKLRAEEQAEEARAAETARAAEPEPPRAIEAKAAPKPRPEQPQSVPGPDGSPRCRRHAHLRHPPPDCTACRELREVS